MDLIEIQKRKKKIQELINEILKNYPESKNNIKDNDYNQLLSRKWQINVQCEND